MNSYATASVLSLGHYGFRGGGGGGGGGGGVHHFRSKMHS